MYKRQTLIDTKFTYKTSTEWENVDIKIRARGNFRLENCYFAPVKIKLKKKKVKNTLLDGHKNLKLVLPCIMQKDNCDNVIKEYLAYKIYEIISPYYFKTRLLDIEFDELKNKKVKSHNIKGFLIEDDKHVAKRYNGKVFERPIHPLEQEAKASVRNAMFQFMIGNEDFSQAKQHNIKLMFIDNNMIPVPYDFDMSGLCNTSYGIVSDTGREVKHTSVTEREYRGFKRSYSYFAEVRQEFLDHKTAIYETFNQCKPLFDNPKEYTRAIDYINDFYEILSDDEEFQRLIVDQARTDR